MTGRLVRTMGRATLVALMLNQILGSGVYGLPAQVSARVGPDAWLAVIGAGLAIAVIVLCFAEVASRFGETGGPYLYVTTAFGAFWGTQIGWLHYLTRLTSAATNANLFVTYLGEFVPSLTGLAAKALVSAIVFGALAALNWRGIRGGARASSVSLALKGVPLLLFAIGGMMLVLARGAVEPANVAAPGPSQWLDAIALLVFAYGGFESGVIAVGEAKRPERDAPFALLIALGSCMLIYTLVQLVTSWALADPSTHPRAVADAARVLAGPTAGAAMAIGVLLSLFGWFVGAMVATPRLTFAMAERGVLPSAFAAVHARFRTPHVSIAAFATISFALTLAGGFLSNLTLSVITRVVIYGFVAAALIVFRRRDGTAQAAPRAQFQLPAGTWFAGVAIAISAALAFRVSRREALIMAVVVALATATWWSGSRRSARPSQAA